MKFVLLAALCASTLAFVVIDEKTAREQLSGQALADYVNSAQNLFVAENVEMTDAEKRSKIMDGKYAAEHTPEVLATARAEIHATIPETFDSRTQWPHCSTIKLVRDQATCGSCWAFSSAEAISDRTCIHSNGAKQPEISAEDILSCCGSTCGNGCEGGYPIEAWRFWGKKGVVTGGDYKGSGCRPYPFAPCTKSPCTESKTPACSLSCQAGYSTSYANDKHFGATAYAVANKVATIQTEILTNGPVVGAFKVYEDFYQYKGGVYKHTAGSYLGGHAIKIIGWGTENGSPYWLIANSWGNSWGEKGFFKMLRGVNECGIEGSVVAGIAK